MTVSTAKTAQMLPDVAWHISSKSDGGSGNCVEAGPILDGSGRVAVRHSHHPDGDVLVYEGPVWISFISQVKGSCFDRH